MKTRYSAAVSAALMVTVALAASPVVHAQTPGKAPKLAPAIPVEQPPNRGFVAPLLDLSYLTFSGKEALPNKADAALPTSWDWRAQGKVTAVRNQSSCGACYAFAAMADAECRILIDDSGTYDFSENQAKECNYYDYSCDGGNYQAVAALISQVGVVLETCDPYVANYDACNSGCTYQKTLTGWDRVSGNTTPSATALKQYIYDNGPVYTSLYAGDANDAAWTNEINNYDGSYTLYYTGAYTTNHAVLIVGWDDALVHAGGTGGWIVKNSWGTSWGGACGYGAEGGYFTIAYGSANVGQWSSHMSTWETYEATDELLYYDEAGWAANIGWPSSTSTTAWGMAKFAPSADEYLRRVEFWTNDVTTDVDVYVYDVFDGTTTSGLIESKLNQSFAYAGYHSVALDNPPLVSSGNAVYVVVKFSNQTAGYALASDDTGPTSADQTWLSLNGASGSWYDAHTSLAANVGIRARFSPSLGLGVEEIEGPVPHEFTLSQNYPNPFNPETRIEFEMARAGYASLKVYNLLGEEVATLVNQTLGAGTFVASWDGRNATGAPAASGVYFYRLETPQGAQSRKMVLLK